MARRYLVAPLPAPGRAVLPQDVAHHLVRVARARRGDPVVLFDGAGREAEGTVAAVERGRVEVEVGPSRAVAREPAVRVTLAFAAPRGARADWLLEHGCEVGVARFWPIVTERTQPVGDSAARVERWRRIVRAAAEQCDRSMVPEVEPPRALAALLAQQGLPAERWFADASGAPLRAAARDAILVVGPEGGLTPGELDALRAGGFGAGSLGPLTLRVETAALVGAVLLQHA